MKCALIIPAWQPEDLFPKKTANAQLNYWQPLGTLYVAAALLQQGHEVEFYNGAFLSHPQILDKVRRFQPQWVGVYATCFSWEGAVETARDVKGVIPRCFTCAGGPYPTSMPELCLQELSVDAVIRGEAEKAVVELADAVLGRRRMDSVLGLSFRCDDDVIHNPDRLPQEDLDQLAMPARQLLQDEMRYLPPPAGYQRAPVAVVMTSRGCNRRCIFCYQMDKNRRSGVRGVRYRSLDNVMAEIQWCLDSGYREIKFIDDSLASDYDRLLELTRRIRQAGLDFTWFASVCANQVDRKLLQAMKDSGCWAVLIGAESGVQKDLNTLRKGIKVEHIETAVRDAKAVGLRVTTPFLFGIPGQTYQDALQSIDFAVRLDPDYANFHALTAFPGTYLYEHLPKYGRVADRLRQYTYQGAAFIPYTLTQQQIQGLRQRALRRFYSRPGFLLRKLMALRSLQDIVVGIRGLVSLFWLYLEKDLFTRHQTHVAAGERLPARETKGSAREISGHIL
ncbi:MAG: B12-binding domain-containing radical SAM protein [Gammaproteobacteria bacterium]|nr:B12-binding domain-containing radical SAM protein [Gammaproteobacteria bacterium]MDH5802545.1 B12-binding domain-containing radical SAM protein [Gammaproteobacteria bacterium]